MDVKVTKQEEVPGFQVTRNYTHGMYHYNGADALKPTELTDAIR